MLGQCVQCPDISGNCPKETGPLEAVQLYFHSLRKLNCFVSLILPVRVGERGKIQDFPKHIPYSSDKCSHSDMITKTGIKPVLMGKTAVSLEFDLLKIFQLSFQLLGFQKQMPVNTLAYYLHTTYLIKSFHKMTCSKGNSSLRYSSFILISSLGSLVDTNVVAVPGLPCRPTLPARCKYSSIFFATSVK